MLETNMTASDASSEIERLGESAITFTHPDEVVNDRNLNAAEKRIILAAWASDAHTVPNIPVMRQLESGAIVHIDTILIALRALDRRESSPSGRLTEPWAKSSLTAFLRLRHLRRRGRDKDDDDDDYPPPCPTAALPPGVELELRRRRDAPWGLLAA